MLSCFVEWILDSSFVQSCRTLVCHTLTVSLSPTNIFLALFRNVCLIWKYTVLLLICVCVARNDGIQNSALGYTTILISHNTSFLSHFNRIHAPRDSFQRASFLSPNVFIFLHHVLLFSPVSQVSMCQYFCVQLNLVLTQGLWEFGWKEGRSIRKRYDKGITALLRAFNCMPFI